MADQIYNLLGDPNFDYRFLRNKLEAVSHSLDGTQAATAANYGVFAHAMAACVVEAVWISHQTAGTDAGAVTLDIEKLTSGTALDSGTTILSSAYDLKGTINTPVNSALNADISRRQIGRGERLALKDSGTLTAVAGVCVTVVLRYKS